MMSDLCGNIKCLWLSIRPPPTAAERQVPVVLAWLIALVSHLLVRRGQREFPGFPCGCVAEHDSNSR